MRWNSPKTLLWFGLIAFVLPIPFIKPAAPTVVEAQSPTRFQRQNSETIDRNHGWNPFNLTVVCDSITGTLIYTTNGGGIWGNPNGCQKNPR